MGCAKSELLILLEYIDRECKDYESCKRIIVELEERVKKIAFVEAINDLF
ncbi:hypothetical protein J5U23_03169 [Saccharolobus shibatae B12]|uniref:Uncharacterized protein B-49 n=2 Tax=root TaxID=1 RepID=B49_SSV1|nr:hypothetical protein [Saccharolobus shibatae]NP_039788.1 ORF B-49 [Sulfolobus spindle-shaped virus 1]P20204.1 RecName: Full=Uncharacterized protein B-49 [Sulfolobus spindle-shaped virus 1]QXJ30272.1 hypothetical protein J5U23_03169 [Saccharolobus shibatae B12]CAA30221.1 ORF B-49 [Sulfolobus spindle-shaped virus 1]